MSDKLMSDDRQEFLVKCAEQSIELMNIGVEPNAALTKVAKDAELNSKEVALVSHAINNSKTLSVLATSEDKDKDKPFTITNADVVNGNLYESDPLVSGDAKKLDKERTKAEDASAGQLLSKNKKEAAEESRVERDSYLDADPIDHATALRAVLGRDNLVQVRVKTAALISDTGEGSLGIEEDAAHEGAEVTRREVGNPYTKLSGVRIQIEEASVMYTRARQDAMDGIDKLANEFRRTDAPAFAHVEEAAILAGMTPETADVVYDMGELQKFGHKRVGTVKTAGVYSMSQREAHLSNVMCGIDKAWQKAANALAVKGVLEDAYVAIEQQIHKHAAAKTDKPEKDATGGHLKDVGNQVSSISSALSTIPEQLSGADFHGKSKAIDLLQSASGDYSDKEGPSFDAPDKSPMGVGFRQELSGADSRGKIDNLLQDEFIRQHPIQDVVGAYNRALSVSPNLGQAELASLVKQDLAAGGAVPLDTLLRTSSSHPAV